jgi:CheY-like chemotaxis protein
MPTPITVVVAEGEGLVRMAAADALSAEGYAVFEAANSEEALTILRAHAADVHVLFTDVHMPGAMDGIALAHYAGRSWPWIGVIITSGIALSYGTGFPANSRFLPKPYALWDVIGHVQQLTAR